MALADLVHSGKRDEPRKLVLNGTPGSGKTSYVTGWSSKTFKEQHSAGMPAPLVLDFEDGLKDIYCNSIPFYAKTGKTYQDLMQTLSAIKAEENLPYHSLALDSIDWLERSLIWPAVCKMKGVASIEDIPYGKGYFEAAGLFKKMLDLLDEIRIEKHVMIVLISHAKIERFEDPRTEAYDRYVSRCNRHVAGLMLEWSDEFLFCTFKVHTTKEDKGFNKSRVRGLGSGERVMYCTEQPSHIAKNRAGLPNELHFSWEAYANAVFPTDAAPTMAEDIKEALEVTKKPVTKSKTPKKKEAVNG